MIPRHPILARSMRAAKGVVAWAQLANRRWQARDLHRVRLEAERQLADFVRASSQPPVGRRVLVDGMFDNPGYWYRLTLLLAALGLDRAQQFGLTGPHSAGPSRKTMKTLGIREVVAFDGLAKIDRATRADARTLAASITRPEDILALQLPHGMPASFLYDAILKRQRAAVVDVTDPWIGHDILECLSALRCAERALERFDPDVVCLSHALNTRYTALACVCASAGRSPVVLFGNYGVPRLWRVEQADDVFNSMDRPSGRDIDSLPIEQAQHLERVGRQYLKMRFEGRATDLAGSWAFTKDSEAAPERLRHELGWQEGKPVVAVYASNWFDFPHAFGMSVFRDFADWIQATLTAAESNTNVNWLFKAHPVDKWYGGITLASLMPETLPPNVRLVPEHWTGGNTMAVADALVTHHGTGAIEYAAVGKPVLVPDRGWYHDCGFALTARSRQDYLGLLASDWFVGRDTTEPSRRAAIFAGWYFCIPEWQDGALLPDDSTQLKMYPAILGQLREHREAIDTEVQTMRAWYESGEPFYHTYKMRNAELYCPSNVV